MLSKRRAKLLIGLSMSFAFSAHADLTLQFKDGGYAKMTAGKHKLYESDQVIYITTQESDTITSINNKRREYTQVSVAQMCERVQQMTAGFSQYKEALEQSNRALAERHKHLQGSDNAEEAFRIERADKQVDIAGFKATQYKVYENDSLTEVLWLSTDKPLVSALKQVPTYNHFAELSQKMSCGLGNGRLGKDNNEAYKTLMNSGLVLKSYEGNEDYILQALAGTLDKATIADLDEEIFSSTEVVRVDFADIPKSEFTIPQGYKKISWEEQMTNGYSQTSNQMEDDAHDLEVPVSEPEAREVQTSDEEQTALDTKDVLDKAKELIEEESEVGSFLFKALGKVLGDDEEENN